MSIPKRGTRKITVNGELFIWLVRRKATYAQECECDGYLHVAVELAKKAGSVLVINTDRHHPKSAWLDYQGYEIGSVKPADVTRWILQAMKIGWQPSTSGASFIVQVSEGSMEKSLR